MLKKLIAAVLTATMLLFAVPALAATTTQAAQYRIATTNVNVRTGPGTKYSLLGYLAKGETVQKTGVSGNWTQVKYNNQTAYVSSTYLTAYTGSGGGTSNPGTSLLYAAVATAVRSGPSTAYRAIGYMDAGDSITYLGVYNGSWYQVQLGVNVGYVYAPDMRVYGSGSSTTGGTVYATSSVPVYSSTSTAAYLLGYLYQGETASRTGTVGSTWTKISFEGRTGYVLTSQVIVSAGGTNTSGFTALNTWMYAINNYTYCYTIPSDQSAYRTGYLSGGEQVWAVATNGTWIQVSVNGTLMYVPASKLANYTGNVGNGSGVIGSTVYVQKYAGAPTYKNTSGTVYDFKENGETVTRVTRGKALTVLFQMGSFYNVSWRDAEGDFHTAYVDVDRVASTYPN